MSQTVGLYFFAEDYIEFLRHLKENCSNEIQEVELENSRYREELLAKGQHVPIGRIGEVEFFLHYSTFAEAKEKWERRCKRINWDSLIVKNAEMNDCTAEIVRQFEELPFKNKFIYTAQDYGVQSHVIFREYLGKDQVKDDTTLFNKYIDLIKLVKGEPFKRKQ